MTEPKFAQELVKLANVVSVVTVGRGGVENGLTVSWVTPVSFEPPQLLIALDKLHYSVEFLDSTKSFVVNLLAKGQQRIAAHFARQSFAGEEKLEKIATHEAPSGAAILSEAIAYYDCEVVGRVESGDHILFIGQIHDAGVLHDGEVLTTADWTSYHKSRPRKHSHLG
ncbi:MAG: flavin reductase family protein [Myxococcota bacterium]